MEELHVKIFSKASKEKQKPKCNQCNPTKNVLGGQKKIEIALD